MHYNNVRESPLIPNSGGLISDLRSPRIGGWRVDEGNPLTQSKSTKSGKRTIWKPLSIFGVVAAIFAAAWYGVPASIAEKSSRYVFKSENDVPQEPVAIVLGAMVYPDGALSPVLQSRVDAGIQLYKSGKVKKLLMSGDNSTSHYNEPTAMKRYAVAHGVPAQDVIRDFAGFHTYDTCYRAKYVFGITNAVFVSQAFHLPRAVYLARQLGIDAVGYVAPDDMSPADLDVLVMRERLATMGALVDLGLHRKPQYPGPPEPGAMTGADPNS